MGQENEFVKNDSIANPPDELAVKFPGKSQEQISEKTNQSLQLAISSSEVCICLEDI